MQHPIINKLLANVERYKRAISEAEKWQISISEVIIAWLGYLSAAINLAEESESTWLKEILAVYIQDIFKQIATVSAHYAESIKAEMTEIKFPNEQKEERENKKLWGNLYLEKLDAALKSYVTSDTTRLNIISNIRAFLSGEAMENQVVIIGKLLYEADRLQSSQTAKLFKLKTQSELATHLYAVIKLMGIQITSEQQAGFIGEYKASIYSPVIFSYNIHL
ncbi:MAG: hypothetical protein ABI597_05930 [Gammaproteobacteria bacterium]